jgi:exopolysaccharide biosynthesis predicted pyruvyltransferase EpsI
MSESPVMQHASLADHLAGLRKEISDQIRPLLDTECFALIDFPDHSNVGDSAIWLGETRFFSINGRKPTYCSSLKSHSHEKMQHEIKGNTIFLHGGGNFGTIWKSHQDFRIDLLNRFPGQRIVQLPQSIFFESAQAVEQTARAIERHGNFILFVRDKPSLDIARRHFQCEVSLCPDMAFYLEPLARKPAAHDFFYLLREDHEKSVVGEISHPGRSVEIDDWLEDDKFAIKMTAVTTKMMGLGLAPQALRFLKFERLARSRLRRGIDMLSSGRVVVTDRLHGHILSTLLAIPHVTLDNSYGKLQNFIDAWTKNIAILRTAASLEQAGKVAEELPP